MMWKFDAARMILAGVGILVLASCAAPPPPVAAAPSPQLLAQAEARGYAEGVAAGERIQARKDGGTVAELAAKTAVVTPPPPAPVPAPAAAVVSPAPAPPVPSGFATEGPATPLVSPNAGGI